MVVEMVSFKPVPFNPKPAITPPEDPTSVTVAVPESVTFPPKLADELPIKLAVDVSTVGAKEGGVSVVNVLSPPYEVPTELMA